MWITNVYFWITSVGNNGDHKNDADAKVANQKRSMRNYEGRVFQESIKILRG